MMKKLTKTTLFNNILLVVGGIVLFFLLRSFGFENVLNNIIQFKHWFWVTLFIWAGVYILWTISFFLIVRDGSEESKSVSFLKAFAITVSGFAINVSNPAGLAGGEPYRILQLRPYIGIEKASSAVILYNMMHFSSHFLIWLLSIPLILLFLNISKGLFIGLSIGFVVLLLLTYIFLKGYKRGMAVKTINLLCRIPLLKKKMQQVRYKHQERLTMIDEHIADLYHNRRKQFIYSLLADLSGRIFSCLEIWIIFYAMGIDANIVEAIVVYSISTLIANLLFFSPMQLGTREGGYMVAIGVLKIAKANIGVFISIITRIREFVWIGIGLLLMKIKIK